MLVGGRCPSHEEIPQIRSIPNEACVSSICSMTASSVEGRARWVATFPFPKNRKALLLLYCVDLAGRFPYLDAILSDAGLLLPD